MRVLMIGRDFNIFEPASAVRSRLVKLAAEVGEIIDLTFTKKSEAKVEVSDQQLKIIPTNSLSPFLYARDAYLKAKIYAPEVITVQDPFLAGLAGVWLKNFFHRPLEIQLHTDVLSPAFKSFSFKNFIYYYLARFTLPRASKVRVVSNHLKQGLINSHVVREDKIYVLPIFVSAPVASTGKPRWWQDELAHKKIIFMAGRLEAEKRYALALKAFAQMADKNTVLVIAGAGTLLSSLQDLAVQLSIDDRVLWAGALSPEEMVRSYEVAHLFLHTSAYEGYGLVLAEAAMVGLPIVATAVGIAEEVGGQISLPTPSDLSHKLSEQLTTPIKSLLPPRVSELEYQATLKSEWSKLL